MLREAAKNALMYIPPVVRLRKRIFSRENDPADRIGAYGDLQWRIYGEMIERCGASVERADVLELGPGPILANGVRFIARGAASYTGVDRFNLLRRDTRVRDAYRQLIESLPPAQRKICSGLISPDNGGEVFDDRIRSVVASSEDVDSQVPFGKYDLVVSFDVLEHVDDIGATLRSVRTLLKPGGLMIHRVDVTAHNVAADVHPLAQLVFSNKQWSRISSRRAIYNRARPSEFFDTAERLGFQTLIFERTRMLSHDEINAIRSLLWGHYARCSYEDLATLDFVWCARSPS